MFEIIVVFNIFEGVVKYLCVWFVEVDKFLVEDVFYQFSDVFSSDGNVIFSYGVEFIIVGYDGWNILFVQQIYNGVDISILVKVFVIQENYCGNFIVFFQVDFVYGFIVEISCQDVMCGIFGVEVSN